MFVDLLKDDAIQLRRNSFRPLLPIMNGFTGWNTGLVFVSPSPPLSVNLCNLDAQSRFGGRDKPVGKSFVFRCQAHTLRALQSNTRPQDRPARTSIPRPTVRRVMLPLFLAGSAHDKCQGRKFAVPHDQHGRCAPHPGTKSVRNPRCRVNPFSTRSQYFSDLLYS
jgi:hypothetical protein